jgi:biotin transport system substrate-specific component
VIRANAWVLDRPLAVARPAWTMALGSLLFAVLTAVGGAVAFPLPFSPVPVTLQTFFTVLAGATLGPVWGAASQITYVMAGIAGMPVFAGGTAGPGVLLGPTGGYLVGFVLAAWIAGMLVRPGGSWPRLVAGLTLAHLVVFVFGLSQLLLYTGRSLPEAVMLGFVPFLGGTVLKIAGAAGILRARRGTGWFRP